MLTSEAKNKNFPTTNQNFGQWSRKQLIPAAKQDHQTTRGPASSIWTKFDSWSSRKPLLTNDASNKNIVNFLIESENFSIGNYEVTNPSRSQKTTKNQEFQLALHVFDIRPREKTYIGAFS